MSLALCCVLCVRVLIVTDEMKLSKTQSELLEAMKGGVVCHYMPYRGWFRPQDYYFRSDTGRRCTAAARSLCDKGLVKVVNKTAYGAHALVVELVQEST